MKNHVLFVKPQTGFNTETLSEFYYYEVRTEDDSWAKVVGDRGDLWMEGGGGLTWVIFYNREERDRDMAEMNERLKEKYGYT